MSVDAPKNASRKPVTGAARLILEITSMVRGKPVTVGYVCRFLESHPSIGKPAFQLTKMKDGSIYNVILTKHGAECDCPDFIWRRNNKDPKGCRHICGLRAVGLLRRTP